MVRPVLAACLLAAAACPAAAQEVDWSRAGGEPRAGGGLVLGPDPYEWDPRPQLRSDG